MDPINPALRNDEPQTNLNCCGQFLLDIAQRVWNAVCTVFNFIVTIVSYPIHLASLGIEWLCSEHRQEEVLPPPQRRVPSPQFSPHFEDQPQPERIQTPPATDATIRAALSAEASAFLFSEFQIQERDFLRALNSLDIPVTQMINDTILMRNATFIFDIMGANDTQATTTTAPTVARALSHDDEEVLPPEVQQWFAQYQPNRFIVNPRHMQAVELEIPDADATITLDQFLIYFNDLRERNQLPTQFDDDRRLRDADDFLQRFQERIAILQDPNANFQDAYHNTIRPAVKAMVLNIVRHLISVLVQRHQAIQEMDPGIEKTRAENNYYADLRQIVQEIGKSFFHCTNRLSTAYEDLYYGYVHPHLFPEGRHGHPFEYYTLAALTLWRKTLFDNACSSDGDRETAPTQKYWRARLGRTYGVPSPLSEQDRQYEDFARQDAAIGQRIQTTFRDSYSVAGIIGELRAYLDNGVDATLSQPRFLSWLGVNFPHDAALLYNEEGILKTEAYLFLLHRIGVIQERA